MAGPVRADAEGWVTTYLYKKLGTRSLLEILFDCQATFLYKGTDLYKGMSMGRKPLGKRPLTGAEAQERYWRKKLLGEQPEVRDADRVENAALKARIKEMEQENSALRRQLKAAQSSVGRSDSALAKGQGQSGRSGRVRGDTLQEQQIAFLKSELALKTMRIKELERVTGPDLAKLIKQVEQLKIDKHNWRQEAKEYAKQRDKDAKELNKYRSNPKYRHAHELLNSQTYNTIIKVLHPDRRQHCTEEEKKEATRLFIEIKPAFSDDD
jgi:hypothetical protein